MKRASIFPFVVLLLCLLNDGLVMAQTEAPLTWEQVRERFEQNNPTLLAGKLIAASQLNLAVAREVAP